MAKLACLILAIALRLVIVCCTKQNNSKQAYFVPVENDTNLAKRELIATFKSPSELACSQKCLNHEKCKYKKFDLKTSTCYLLEGFGQEDVTPALILTKKETCLTKRTSGCKVTPADRCGENCFKSSVCDYRERGVYSNCYSALLKNSFIRAIYWIFSARFSQLMALECMLDNTGESVVLFHHDNENATLVHGYEAEGSYSRKLIYDVDIETIIMNINKSSSCKQHTKADCHNVMLDRFNWISGRGGRRLNYWGGGPSDGKGCACGINSTCATTSKKCNCNENDNEWRRDEGFVTKKEDLPITAINAGDTGRKAEKLIYTIGPLMCVF